MRAIHVGIIACFAIGAGIILFSRDDRPDVLQTATGCYEAAGDVRPAMVRVREDGTLIVGTSQTPVSGHHDKGGDALNPQAKVVALSGTPLRIEVESGNPLLLRFSQGHRTLIIPGEATADVDFVRSDCRRL